MHHSAIVVLTKKSTPTLLQEGGSSSWKISIKKIADYEYLVCTKNSRHDLSEHDLGHGTAFFVGRISGIKPVSGRAGRQLIKVKEYAEIEIKGVWGGWRNPIKYTTLEIIGIDPYSLDFKAMPEPSYSFTEPAPLKFNSLLQAEGIDPSEVRLIRHTEQRHNVNLYDVWQSDRAKFEEYQTYQSSVKTDKRFQNARYFASFISKKLENEDN